MGPGSAVPSRTAPGALASLAACACLLAGCANPGPPRPPSLHLPNPVADLAANRTGDVLDLTWTTPDRSTEDLVLTGPLIAEICEAPSTAEAACHPTQRLSVKPGPSHTTLPLSAMSVAGPPALLVVRIRLLNAAGHSAALSAPARSAAGVAPSAVADLSAQPSPGGVTLHWTPIPGSAAVLLRRSTVPTAPPAPGKTRDTDITLQAETSQGTDPGGAIDRSAQLGVTYRYTAERVRTLQIDGQAISLRSLASAPATVLVRDTFPPAPPTGLASIPGTPGQATPTIELSWEPSPEPDLAGYLVDRAEPSKPDTWTRLTPAPLAAPAFRDATVTPGHTYLYRVLALDTAGNQSRPGAPIEETAAPTP